jgi:hypothetical protein
MVIGEVFGDGMEHPGRGSSQMWAIRSLYNSIQNGIQTNGAEDLPEWTLTDLAQHNPSKFDQPQ